MLDSRATLPWHSRALNKTAEVLRLQKLPPASLNEEVLCNEAIKNTGLTDFGDPHFREGLSILIDSAENDANLHFLGRFFLHNYITVFLSNRLLLAELSKQTPELFQTPLIPPIIILGLPRSGTTFLHRMLAADPANRGIPLWELVRPISGRTSDNRRQIYNREFKFHSWMVPRFDRIHSTGSDAFEECIFLMGTTFVSIYFWVFWPVYGYLEWTKSHKKLKAYQEYRSLLQILQRVSPSRRLVMKAPGHLISLDSLIEVIPDALIIQTHRHPVPACNSYNSLVREFHSWGTKKHDISRLAKANIDWCEDAVALSMKCHDTNPDKIYDVNYDQLVSDPLSTVKGIYSHFKLDWSNDYEQQLKTYIRDNPQGKHGKHEYNASDFGLTDGEISERFDMYINRFGLNN